LSRLIPLEGPLSISDNLKVRDLDLPLRIVLMISGILFVFALPTLIGIGKTLTTNFKPFWKFIEINIQKLTQINDPQFMDLFEQMNMAESYVIR
jgi:peptide/nickel transport system permease protein